MAHAGSRVVFDCNIFLQSIINRNRPAAKCLRLAELGNILLFATPETIAELRDVLSRPTISKLIQDYSTDSIDRFIAGVLVVSTLITDTPMRFQLARDPNDDPYLNLAIEIEADFIITWDRDMLDLMVAFSDEAKDFRRRFRNIRILDPVAFLEIMTTTDLGIAP